MADDKDLDSSSAAPRLSVHRTLGGGAVADVLLWRRRHTAALVAVGATAAWLLFEWGGYSPLSLASNALLLLAAILFFWARSASLLNRPLPPLPNLEISEEMVGRVASEARLWINRALAIAHDIAIGRDRKLFLQVNLVLWLVSYVGSFFNFLTLVYLGVLLLLTVPALYDKYQDHVDEKLGVAHSLLLQHYDNVQSKILKQPIKEKKTQ